MAGYDPKKAEAFNKFKQQGLTEDQAWTQAGLTDDDIATYVINDSPYNNDGTKNTNRGQMGPLIVGSGTVQPELTADEKAYRASVDAAGAGFDKRLAADSANFDNTKNVERVAYPVKADSRPSTATPITYTTTSTEQVSGGGSTTITAGQFKENAATRSLQPEIDAKQAELTQSYKDYPVSNRGREKAGLPLLTPDELQANQERATAISKEKVALQYKQQDAGTPSEPTVTTVPNTTTTESTTTYSKSVANSGLEDATVVQAPGGPDPTVEAQYETQTAIENVPAGSITAEPNQVPVQDSLAPGEELVNTSAPEPQQIETFNEGQSTITTVTDAPTPVDQQTFETGGGGGNQGTITRVSTDPTDVDAATDPGVSTGGNESTVNIGTDENRGGNLEKATLDQAKQQAAIQARFNQPANGDWRVRIRLAPNSNYLYNDSSPGILAPLKASDGVIFPYTPSIQTTYNANYDVTDLTHSNYRGQFYKNSNTGDISITGIFTAQDTAEAEYMLAVIHFFRSVTKMFYGQDAQRGAPPPLVYLFGLGQYQFNNHPCVVKSFTYNLPTDVDYIRTQPNNYGVNLLNRRTPSVSTPANTIGSVIGRLSNAVDLLGNILKPGALSGLGSSRAGQPGVAQQAVYNTSNATYVPTKIEIQLSLLPIQTRNQVSQQFSLKGYANGDLLRGGFW